MAQACHGKLDLYRIDEVGEGIFRVLHPCRADARWYGTQSPGGIPPAPRHLQDGDLLHGDGEVEMGRAPLPHTPAIEEGEGSPRPRLLQQKLAARRQHRSGDGGPDPVMGKLFEFLIDEAEKRARFSLFECDHGRQHGQQAPIGRGIEGNMFKALSRVSQRPRCFRHVAALQRDQTSVQINVKQKKMSAGPAVVILRAIGKFPGEGQFVLIDCADQHGVVEHTTIQVVVKLQLAWKLRQFLLQGSGNGGTLEGCHDEAKQTQAQRIMSFADGGVNVKKPLAEMLREHMPRAAEIAGFQSIHGGRYDQNLLFLCEFGGKSPQHRGAEVEPVEIDEIGATEIGEEIGGMLVIACGLGKAENIDRRRGNLTVP